MLGDNVEDRREGQEHPGETAYIIILADGNVLIPNERNFAWLAAALGDDELEAKLASSQTTFEFGEQMCG